MHINTRLYAHELDCVSFFQLSLLEQVEIICLLNCLVGTFGQPDTWDIYDSDTFQHPMVPYDVLVDPLSLPSHPVIQEREAVLDILYG